MVLIYQKIAIYSKMTQIGAVGGGFWRIGSEMLGSRRGQLGMCDPAGNIQAQVLTVLPGSGA
jgi:hypothetical protein